MQRMLQAFCVSACLVNLTANTKKKTQNQDGYIRPIPGHLQTGYTETAVRKGGNKQMAVSHMGCMQEAFSLILMREMNQRVDIRTSLST